MRSARLAWATGDTVLKQGGWKGVPGEMAQWVKGLLYKYDNLDLHPHNQNKIGAMRHVLIIPGSRNGEFQVQ